MKKILIFMIIFSILISSIAFAGPKVCGNGILESGEQCDDGNAIDDDHCSNQCKITCQGYGYDRTKEGGVESIDEECREAGFAFGIAKWEWNGTAFVLEDSRAGYTVSISGDDSSATWTSSPAAAGSLSKEGQCYQDMSGGSSGTFNKNRYGISHVTLCGEGNDIPEFTTLGAAFALAGAGIYIYRKRK